MADDILLREVDDDLRRDRMRAFWRRYRRPLLVAVIALILGTAAVNMWRDYQTKKAGETMAKLDNAIISLEQGKPADAQKRFATLAEESHGEIRDIARLWQARAAAENQDANATVKTLNDLAAHPAGDDLIWRDLACLRLMSAGADAPKDCATKSDSPLRAQRLEWQAALLWQQGKNDEARALLDDIAKDDSASKPQRARAERMRRVLGEGK